jgi:peptidoglycan/xylan/chitin deacetylase (PgdA/CDA1 family)
VPTVLFLTTTTSLAGGGSADLATAAAGTVVGSTASSTSTAAMPASALTSATAVPAATATTVATAASPPASLAEQAAVPHPLGVVVSRVETARNVVALTFDSNMTDDMLAKLDAHKVDTYANTEVIDILEREKVPATFFLAAKWVERYPDLTKRLVASPLWEVGSHSYQHKGFTPSCYTLATLASAEMANDVTKSFATLAPFGGNQVPYFRFPGLCVDDAAMAAIAPTKVSVIHGDVASGDAFGTNARAIVDQVLTRVKPGSIVVLHITKANAPKTQEALPDIISGLRAKGYELVKVSDLLRSGSPA